MFDYKKKKHFLVHKNQIHYDIYVYENAEAQNKLLYTEEKKQKWIYKQQQNGKTSFRMDEIFQHPKHFHNI